MPPKQVQKRKSQNRRNHWNKYKNNQKGKRKQNRGIYKISNIHHPMYCQSHNILILTQFPGDADMSELASIFNSANKSKKKPRNNRSKSKSKSNSTSNDNNSKQTKQIKLDTSKKSNLSLIKSKTAALFNTKSSLTTNSNKAIPYISPRKQRKMLEKLQSKKQLASLPNNILIPKCSLCSNKLVIKRGDQCYDGYASVSCDYCGREDIHGSVWHCDNCSDNDNDNNNGFNLCRTCGYLISHGRKNEIRRVAPPNDDMGLLFNKASRNRSKTLDGFTIYKHDEIQKTLKIGIGGGSKLCPFDCECCF